MHRIATVINPADSLLLTDVATMKDELGIAADDTSKDARLARYIAEASSQIHSFCKRIFPVQTYRNSFRQPRHCEDYGPLILSDAPLVELLGISEDGIALDAACYETDATPGFIWRLHDGFGWHHRPRRGWRGCEVTVDFRAGFEEIPPDVAAAAIETVTYLQSVRGRDPLLKAREGPTYGREEWWIGPMPQMTGGLPQRAAQMLEGYLQPVAL